MIRLVHVITDLSVGGAQNMLFKLLSRTDRSVFEPSVVSLKAIGPVGERIQSLGVPVTDLKMSASAPDPGAMIRLAGILKRQNPHIVQTWLYHADLIGGIASKMSGRAILLWNIRHSHLDPATIKRSTILIGRLCARLSRSVPDKIVCCSEVGLGVHSDLGYCKRKMMVIPNGFNLTEFAPDASARCSVRQELGIPIDSPIIGLVGRFHPMKDHKRFVQCASELHSRRPDVYYVLCGDNVDWDNPDLAATVREGKIAENVRLLGRRTDLPRLNAAFDIATLCSKYGEGFPNVVGEAMACGVACVVTDVGDSGYIVGDTGRVIPPEDTSALVSAWTELLEMPETERRALGARARARVEERFDIGAVVEKYESLYMGMLDENRAPKRIER